MKFNLLWSPLLLLAFAGTFLGQENETSANAQTTPQPLSVPMVARSIQAVDYRSGATTAVDLKGTDLMPELNGKAKVISKRALTDIHVELERLRPAKSIDLAYLTYVLWTISPQGHAKNIGELLEHEGKASLHTTTDMQAFALVVTAEPDFAVAEPSDMVVAENSLRNDTQGRPESVDVRYQTFPRSTYAAQVTPIQNLVYGEDKKAPLELLQARNAVRIAKDSNAQQYAPEVLNKAETLLNQAEDYYRRKQGEKSIATVAREATQTAEEARVASLRGAEEARVEQQRKENEERAARARADAERAQQQAQAAQQHAQAEAQQRAAMEQQAQLDAAHRQQLEQQQQAAQRAAQQAQQQAQEAEQRAQQETQQRAAAEQQQQQAAQQAEQARQQAQQAQQRAAQVESQQAQMRQNLMNQLNQVLQTRDSARGLIVSMPDVLFNTGSADLKSSARERLAKVAGILIAYPDIHLEVDGYTDNTGNPMFNEQLSQQRAASVQSYLVQQGVPAESIGIRGFGEANPIASNETATGRQQNRRVELVVSGPSIGTQQQATQ